MKNREVAAVFDEIARLLELSGENPFKIRSYVNGARLLEQLDEDIEQVVREGRLRELKGIGPALAQKIEELLATGSLLFLETLRMQFPETLFDLFNLPGLGPKRIHTLYQELNVESLEDLEQACHLGRVKDLDGFGAKTQQKILQAISHLASQQGRFLLNRILPAAQELMTVLYAARLHQRMALAGSLRRGRELVKDIDIIASSRDAAALMRHFTTLPGIREVTGHGRSKSSVILESGIPVDLRVVDDAQFPCALVHFTGSREHNIVLRRRAKERGLRLNEYGLAREDGTMLPIPDEAALYRALDLPCIPPELREDHGEFSGETLPRLVERKDLKGVIHCHTSYSDGHNTLVQMASACQALGYRYLVVSDHSQSATYAGGLRPERVREQHGEIDALNNSLEGFRVLKGIESDIRLDGSLDYDEFTLKTFELVLISVHSQLEMKEQEATTRIIRAIENPYSDVLAHPTGRLLLSRPGYPLNMEKVFDACVRNHVAIEINANCRRLDLDWRWIKLARDKGVRFIIAPDAHSVERFDYIPYGLAIARKGWLEARHVLNHLSAEELLTWRKSR